MKTGTGGSTDGVSVEPDRQLRRWRVRGGTSVEAEAETLRVRGRANTTGGRGSSRFAVMDVGDIAGLAGGGVLAAVLVPCASARSWRPGAAVIGTAVVLRLRGRPRVGR